MRVKFSDAMFNSFVLLATVALLLRKIVLDALADYVKALAACRRLRRRRARRHGKTARPKDQARRLN
jgi:hypothetical protein